MPLKDLPEYPVAREIRLSDKEGFAELLQTMQPQISEYTFTNLYAWRGSRMCLLSSIGGAPIILREYGELRHLMSPPVKEGINELIELLREIGETPPIYGVLKEEAEALAELGFEVRPDRDNWDYVYSVTDLIELKGSKFRGKRQNIHKCLSEHNCEYVEIDGSITAECRKFYDRWCRNRECWEDIELEAEVETIKETLKHYDELPVFGAAIYVDGSLEAFTIGERLNVETAVVHFEKADPTVRGLYQLLNNWFCTNRLKEFRWVNREQDLGIPGLRRAKMDYNPHHFIEKYTVNPTRMGST